MQTWLHYFDCSFPNPNPYVMVYVLQIEGYRNIGHVYICPHPRVMKNCAGQNEKHFCTALLMSFQLNDCYRPQTKLQEGNDFTPVCHSVYRGGEYDVTFCFLRGIISLPVWSHVPSRGGGGYGPRTYI